MDGRAGAAVRLHFNSRPSARGDPVLVRVVSAGCISIHAPPRGATKLGAERLSRL